MQQPAPDQGAHRDGVVRVPAQAGAYEPDPYLQVEVVVERLARLLQGAQSLAERPTAVGAPGHGDRADRLQAGIALARQAIASAAVIDLDTVARPASDRRRAERRVRSQRDGRDTSRNGQPQTG